MFELVSKCLCAPCAIGTLFRMSQAAEVLRHTLRRNIMLPCGNCREYGGKDSFEAFKLRQDQRQLSSYSRISCMPDAFVCKIRKHFERLRLVAAKCWLKSWRMYAIPAEPQALLHKSAAKEEFTGQMSRSIRFNQPQQQFIRQPWMMSLSIKMLFRLP